jgi:hypothetical protein
MFKAEYLTRWTSREVSGQYEAELSSAYNAPQVTCPC